MGACFATRWRVWIVLLWMNAFPISFLVLSCYWPAVSCGCSTVPCSFQRQGFLIQKEPLCFVLQPSVVRYLTVMTHIVWDLFSSQYPWPSQEYFCLCKQNLTINLALFTCYAPTCNVLSDTKTDVHNNKGIYHLEFDVKNALLILVGVELL